uniref:Uncharacterized protein n=1 Tax=Strongyloides venezuelensis TaxID=75913 RepID=A0A0K0FWV5_STRVS
MLKILPRISRLVVSRQLCQATI